MAYITLTHVVLQEKGDNAYTGYCPELGTATCGDTPDEAMQNLGEAVVMHLNAIEETGERKKFFKEKGIEIINDSQQYLTLLRNKLAHTSSKKWLDPCLTPGLASAVLEEIEGKPVRAEKRCW